MPGSSKARKPQTKRSAKKPDRIDPERKVEEAEHTLSKMEGKESETVTVETPQLGNKYEPKEKIGTPKLGRSPNYVTKVGLGKLKVTTAHGNTDV